MSSTSRGNQTKIKNVYLILNYAILIVLFIWFTVCKKNTQKNMTKNSEKHFTSWQGTSYKFYN